MIDVCIYSINDDQGQLSGYRCGCGKTRSGLPTKHAYEALMAHAKKCGPPRPEERSEAEEWAARHFDAKRP